MSTSPITAKVFPSHAIQACCDRESSRYALGAVQLIPVRQIVDVQIGVNVDHSPLMARQPVNEVYATATDSRCLAVVKLDGMTVEPALCPFDMIKPDSKPKKHGRKSVELNGRWESNRGTVAPIHEGRFPNVEHVLPRSFGDFAVVRFDPRILAKIAEAITNEENRGIDLIIPINSEHEDPIRVNGVNGFGVLMPVGVDDMDYEDHCETAQREFMEKVKAFTANNNSTIDDTERQAMVKELLNPSVAPSV